MSAYTSPYPVNFNFTGVSYTPPLSGSIVMEFDDAVIPSDPGDEIAAANFLMLLPM